MLTGAIWSGHRPEWYHAQVQLESGRTHSNSSRGTDLIWASLESLDYLVCWRPQEIRLLRLSAAFKMLSASRMVCFCSSLLGFSDVPCNCSKHQPPKMHGQCSWNLLPSPVCALHSFCSKLMQEQTSSYACQASRQHLSLFVGIL